jgi:hypothetical protein
MSDKACLSRRRDDYRRAMNLNELPLPATLKMIKFPGPVIRDIK